MKNKKIIFNLTIDDLKELGIIRKRKRRQRKIKYINGIPSNIKSVSNHMTGYSNEFKNTDNLKTENLRLQNNVLTKYPEALQLQSAYEDRFNNIDEQYNNTRKIYENILAQTYRRRIQNNNLDDDDTLSSDTRVERLSSRYGDPDDDIDVPQTGGSDSWQGYDNIIDPPDVATSPQPEPQNMPQTGIRSPPNSIIDFRSTKSDDESNVDINDIINSSDGGGYNYKFVEEEDDENSDMPNNQEFNTKQAGIRSTPNSIIDFRSTKSDDESNNNINDVVNSSVGEGYNYKFVEEEDDEKKSDAPNNPEVNTQQITPEEEQFTPLTEENLEKHTGATNQQPALTKNQIKYQKSQAVLAQAKQEYINAGGKDSVILASSNRNLGSIRAATIILQDSTKKTTKKKGKKKK